MKRGRVLFGYVKAFKPQMRVCEYETYRAVYCGLCKTMGEQFGSLSRFTLSYDFTFLAVLGMAVSPNNPEISKGRCSFNPTKRMHICSSNDALIFSADMAILLLWHKLIDNEQDGKFWQSLLSKFGKFKIKKAYNKAVLRNLEISKTICDCMSEQKLLEDSACSEIDRVAHPSAHLLGTITQSLSTDEGQQRVLYRLGYLVGRYVYLSDALDDLHEDKKSGNFNPFLLAEKSSIDPKQSLRDRGRGTLNFTIAELENTFNLLECHCFEPILENIICLGLTAVVDEIYKCDGDTKKKKDRLRDKYSD